MLAQSGKGLMAICSPPFLLLAGLSLIIPKQRLCGGIITWKLMMASLFAVKIPRHDWASGRLHW